MTAKVLDGKAVATKLIDEAGRSAELWSDGGGSDVTLALLAVGSDPSLASHARSIRRSAERAAIRLIETELPSGAAQEAVEQQLDLLVADPSIHGVLIQEPVPDGIDLAALYDRLDPAQDVDGVTAVNAGRLLQHRGAFHPPSTAAGGLAILDHYDIVLEGCRAVVVGRSDIVGKPMALLLMHRHATVTIAHSRTDDLAGLCRTADLLCVAVGRAGLVTPDMVKPGATVVDFGINPSGAGVVGDVAPDVAEVAGALTPVPGGTGPATTASLVWNTARAAWWATPAPVDREPGDRRTRRASRRKPAAGPT